MKVKINNGRSQANIEVGALLYNGISWFEVVGIFSDGSGIVKHTELDDYSDVNNFRWVGKIKEKKITDWKAVIER